MIRFRNFLPLVALLVGAAILGAPASAHATFSVEVFDDGVSFGTATIIPSQPPRNGCFFQTQRTSRRVGSASIQMNGNGTLSVSYNSSVTAVMSGTHTLTLLVTNTGYTLPTGSPVLLSSSGGGSYIGAPGDSVSGTTMGFLDSHDQQFGDGTGSAITVNSPSGTVTPNSQSTP